MMKTKLSKKINPHRITCYTLSGFAAALVGTALGLEDVPRLMIGCMGLGYSIGVMVGEEWV